MESKTLTCMIIIIVATFLGITIYRVQTLPKGKNCDNIDHTSSVKKVNCDDYTYFEKFRYVWNLY